MRRVILWGELGKENAAFLGAHLASSAAVIAELSAELSAETSISMLPLGKLQLVKRHGSHFHSAH